MGGWLLAVGQMPIADGQQLSDNSLMPIEVCLESVPGQDSSVARCSLCKEEFHYSPVGPRQCMANFPAHMNEKHPEAAFNKNPWELFRRRAPK